MADQSTHPADLSKSAGQIDASEPSDARVKAAIEAWFAPSDDMHDFKARMTSALAAAADAAQGGEAAEDGATIAGLESACGHLSALVDATTLLLKELRDYTNDLHENRCLGGGPERGDVSLLDRVDDWLEQRVIPATAPAAVPAQVIALAEPPAFPILARIAPSHWMPLPAAPEQKGGEA